MTLKTSLTNAAKSPHFWKVWLVPHLLLAVGLTSGLAAQNAAGFFLTWLVFYTLISGLGVAVGFHRYFSHCAFKTSKLWQQAMLFFGCLACQGNPLFWVALHRGSHHRYADTDKDPHSPVTHSWWHAYQGYSFDPNLAKAVSLRSATDFMRRPDWQWSVKRYHTVLWLSWLAVAVVSLVFQTPWLFFGLIAAQVWAINQEALVNLLGHTSGFGAYRNYALPDKSVNRQLLGLITWGQALHNNHHAHPNAPDFGVDWHELDPSIVLICLIRSKDTYIQLDH